MEHFSYLDTVSKLASNDWGKDYASSEDAQRELLLHPDKLAAFSVLELVRGFNKFIASFNAKGDENDDIDKRLKGALKLDGFHIGDKVYACDELDCGAREEIIVSHDDDGYPLSIETCFDSDFPSWGSRRSYIYGPMYRNRSDAILAEARRDVEYHRQRLNRALLVIAAIENGTDFDHLLQDINGIEMDLKSV